MKKIMKKALSLVLVMAMMLVPMTTALAADNTSVEMAAELQGTENVEIVVGANETLYYCYGNSRMGTGGNKLLSVEAAPGLKLLTGYDETGANPTVHDLDEYPDFDWAFISDVFVKANNWGMISFALKNTTDSEITCYVTLGEPLGSEKNPDYLVQGENIAHTTGGWSGYKYVWTAPKSGTLTLTMSDENENGWYYDIYEDGDSVADYGQSDAYDEVNSSWTIDVTAGAEYTVVVNTSEKDAQYNEVAGDVIFTVVYSATEKDEYAYNYQNIEVGENELTLDGSAITTIYGFSAASPGAYTITAPEGCKVSYWGDNEWNLVKESSNETNVYEFEYATAGPSLYFGISGTAQPIVTIERTGDLDDGDVNPNPNPTPSEYTNYVNTVTPVMYEFTGNADNLFYVWLEDGANPTAVLGSDGYYHLGSATGPVLYVDLDMDMHPYYTVAGLHAVAGEGRLYHYNNKIDYSTALLSYAAYKDSETGLYPVTEDIKEIIVKYGDGQWWYNPDGPAYLFENKDIDEDSMWLFMCCYEGVIDTTATDTIWTTDSKEGFVFKVNAEISDFLELKINGEVVDEEYYTLTEGSTIITVSADYMKTLATGDYTVAAVFTNAEGEEVAFTTVLTVAAPTSTPIVPGNTGDSSNIALWIAILGLGVVAIAGSVVMKKREF